MAKILSCGKGLIGMGLYSLAILEIIRSLTCRLFFLTLNLYHTIPTFNDPEEKSLLKTLWEKKKMLVSAFSPFPRMIQKEISIFK